MKDESLALRRIIRLQRQLTELGYRPDDIFGALDDLALLKKAGARVRSDNDGHRYVELPAEKSF